MNRRTTDELYKELTEDIEAFGEHRMVYAWFMELERKKIELMDYSFRKEGNCRDKECLGVLLNCIRWKMKE